LSGDDAHRNDGSGFQEGTRRCGCARPIVAKAGAGPS
jgi:hypothetical protein